MKLQRAKAFSWSFGFTTSIGIIKIKIVTAFVLYMCMGEAPKWVIADEHQRQPPLMTTIVVPGKSSQYTIIMGFPWSWIGSVSLLESPGGL
jgi:hypothetical protein